jgi:5-methyltetrahydrofolate--homocysteine methyltransferase
MSALLTTTMVFMQDVIHAISEAGLREQVKIMVGGAPLTEEFAQRIGADGYAPNAAEAADLAKQWVRAKPSAR